MITVTEEAAKKIQDSLKGRTDNPVVRVYIAGVG
jgi:Fe-S cluster assembly iron-binding protein IscA